jgi:hypothetical protein
VTLDEWVKTNSVERIDFIKMDVEGCEKYVIEGASSAIERLKPTILTEFNTHSLWHYFQIDPEDYFRSLATRFKYVYIILSRGDLRRIRHFGDLSAVLTPERFWADLLCAHSPVEIGRSPLS